MRRCVLVRARVELELMQTTISARMTVRCIEASKWGAERLDGCLVLSASSASWCNLGQRHERLYDEAKETGA